MKRRFNKNRVAMYCTHMASISKLVPGQILYSLERQRMGNTMVSRTALYTVKVESIAEDKQSIMASWNSNPAREYLEFQVKKLRVKRPEPKRMILGFPSY